MGSVGTHLYGEQEEEWWQLGGGSLDLSKSKVTIRLKSTEYSIKGPQGEDDEDQTGPPPTHFLCECGLQRAFERKEIWRWGERGQDCCLGLGRLCSRIPDTCVPSLG